MRRRAQGLRTPGSADAGSRAKISSLREPRSCSGGDRQRTRRDARRMALHRHDLVVLGKLVEGHTDEFQLALAGQPHAWEEIEAGVVVAPEKVERMQQE